MGSQRVRHDLATEYICTSVLFLLFSVVNLNPTLSSINIVMTTCICSCLGVFLPIFFFAVCFYHFLWLYISGFCLLIQIESLAYGDLKPFTFNISYILGCISSIVIYVDYHPSWLSVLLIYILPGMIKLVWFIPFRNLLW